MLTFSYCWTQTVTFKFSDGIYNENLKNSVEQSISHLLTNINRAAQQKSQEINMTDVKIAPQAKEALNELWEFMPFSCDDNANVERCLQTVTGYQVRGIPVTVRDKQDTDSNPERELTIGFNQRGEITGVFFALEKHMVNSIKKTGSEVTDIRQREEILNFVERYRSYYDQKDLKSIEDIFSDDAIIITGREVTRKSQEGIMVTVTEYKEQNKPEYISQLRNIFNKKSFIKVRFRSIDLKRHPTRKDVYFVTLHQNWQSPGYEDNGYVVLVWQFPNNGGDPRIMVRTWQSDRIIKTQNDVFNYNDFEIQ